MIDNNRGENEKVAGRSRRPVLVAGGAVLLLIIITALAITYDILNSNRQPAAGDHTASTLGSQQEQVVFEEDFYFMTAPPGWQKVSKPAFATGKQPDYQYRRTQNNLVLQQLSVFVDDIPNDFQLTHVMPVEVSGPRILPARISPSCDSLADSSHPTRSQRLEWFGVTFICDPDRGAFIVGTSHSEQGYSLRVAGSSSAHTYFFVFDDVQTIPQLDAMSRIIGSFEAK